MKKLYTFLTLFLSVNMLMAASVSEQDALLVAKTQFKMVKNLPDRLGITGTLVYSREYQKNDLSLAPAFYVFNLNGEEGFVIVAGDDKVTPILAYSLKGGFDGTNLPEGVDKLMMMYRNQIARIANDVNITTHPSIANKWNLFLADRVIQTGARSSGVGPLTTTEWSQRPRYNKHCPGTNAPTGCVQTAIAQVMKYWNHPVQGKGNHSFNHNTYGTLSANFGSTTYDWTNMTNKLTSASDSIEIEAVAKLMYHVGVAMEANYSESGTGAYTRRCKTILPRHFGYKSGIRSVARSWHSATSWKNTMKAELDAGRILLHEGFCPDPSAGHAFVVDGYDTTGKFHYNWGWSGSYNGFFEADSLAPGSTYTWNQGQKIFTKIEPLPASVDVNLASNIVIAPSVINFNDTFAVSVSIANFGTGIYNGRYRVSLFDEDDNNVGNIDTVFTSPINPNDTIHLTFPSNGLSVTPGTYKLGVYSDAGTNNQWKLINKHNFINPVNVTITSSNNLGLIANDNIIANPNPLKQHDSASILIDILNSDVNPFNGTISVDLHDLNGNWIREIGSYDTTIIANNSLVLLFDEDSIIEIPGSYQLVIWHKPNGSTWEIIEEGTYPNSLDIDVIGLSFTGDLADQYEANDTITSAYELPLTYVNDYAVTKTTDANIHVWGDKDYFKVHLEPNYTYLVYARMYDSYNDQGRGPFTNDMMFNYVFRTDEGLYYDDAEMPTVLVNNVNPVSGEDFFFEVLSFYPDNINNNVGTYEFEVEVIRQGATTGIGENYDPNVMIYPNPASQNLNITHEGYTSIAIISLNGQLVKSFNTSNASSIINVSELDAGSYFVQLTGNNKIVTKKIEVIK